MIARERPEGLILSMGGQTGLNTGIALEKAGILEKYDVRVLGTQVDVIEATEDRGIFNEKLNEIGEKIAPSFACTTTEEALAIVDAFLGAEWSEAPRHQRRIDILADYEKTHVAPPVPGA